MNSPVFSPKSVHYSELSAQITNALESDKEQHNTRSTLKCQANRLGGYKKGAAFGQN